MKQEPANWELTTIQSRFAYLRLSKAQALKVYNYELGLRSEPIFSSWEELDYERDTLSSILSPAQLVKYNRQDDRAAYLEKYIRDNDKHYTGQVKYNSAVLKYMQRIFIQDLLQTRELQNYSLITREGKCKPKVDLVNASYQELLQRNRKQTIATHYRFNRSFAPNELKNALLRHEIHSLWPFLSISRQDVDAPTVAACQFLTDHLQVHFNQVDPILIEKLEVLNLKTRKLWKMYMGEPKGWVVNVASNDEEPRECRFLGLLQLFK